MRRLSIEEFAELTEILRDITEEPFHKLVEEVKKPKSFVVWRVKSNNYKMQYIFLPVASVDLYNLVKVLKNFFVRNINFIPKPEGKLSINTLKDLVYFENYIEYETFEESLRVQKDREDISNLNTIIHNKFLSILNNHIESLGNDRRRLYYTEISEFMNKLFSTYNKPILHISKPDINDYLVYFLENEPIKTRHKFMVYSFVNYIFFEFQSNLKDPVSFESTFGSFIKSQAQIHNLYKLALNKIEEICLKKSALKYKVDFFSNIFDKKDDLKLDTYQPIFHKFFKDLVKDIDKLGEKIDVLEVMIDKLEKYINTKSFEVSLDNILYPSCISNSFCGLLIEPCLSKNISFGNENDEQYIHYKNRTLKFKYKKFDYNKMESQKKEKLEYLELLKATIHLLENSIRQIYKKDRIPLKIVAIYNKNISSLYENSHDVRFQFHLDIPDLVGYRGIENFRGFFITFNTKSESLNNNRRIKELNELKKKIEKAIEEDSTLRKIYLNIYMRSISMCI